MFQMIHFNGYIYILNTSEVNRVNVSEYGNGCDFKHEIIEYRGNNCLIPTRGYCLIKCVHFSTGEAYKQQYLDFKRNEKIRCKFFMTKARIQPVCRANNFNLGYFDGITVFPRTIMERNKALQIHNNHFCVIMKSLY